MSLSSQLITMIYWQPNPGQLKENTQTEKQTGTAKEKEHAVNSLIVVLVSSAILALGNVCDSYLLFIIYYLLVKLIKSFLFWFFLFFYHSIYCWLPVMVNKDFQTDKIQMPTRALGERRPSPRQLITKHRHHHYYLWSWRQKPTIVLITQYQKLLQKFLDTSQPSKIHTNFFSITSWVISKIR